MKRFYDSLSEKDRRRYAGIEALKYGLGCRSYIAKVLGCRRRTVSRGAQEVSQLSSAEVAQRIRRPGAGRKPYEEAWAEIDEKFLRVLHDHTAGAPMDATVRWTDLTVGQIAGRFRDYKRLGFFTTLATSYNCHKKERNGNAYQRNHEYWPSSRLCRL